MTPGIGNLLTANTVQEHTLAFGFSNRPMSTISHDGIFKFTVDATDENTKAFVELLETFLKRRLTAIEVTYHDTRPSTSDS